MFRLSDNDYFTIILIQFTHNAKIYTHYNHILAIVDISFKVGLTLLSIILQLAALN